jgi:hypothetical protein
MANVFVTILIPGVLTCQLLRPSLGGCRISKVSSIGLYSQSIVLVYKPIRCT